MTLRHGAAYVVLAFTAACTTRAPDVASTPKPVSATAQPASSQTVRVTFTGAPALEVEVASTPAARQRGLMHRPELPAGKGMLFVFPGESSGGFWMKNTLVPLSIAYVHGDRVVSTAEMTPCPAAQSCPTYASAGPYTAAVEAPGGFFPAHRVGPGTRMQIEGPTPAAS